MTNLVDRYVFTALRRIPEQQRADIDRELRASIEDAVDARVDAGETREAAVETTLTELGDPERLADRYAGRPGHLIGPDVYPLWRRLVTTLLWTVLPIMATISVVVQLFEDADIGKIIGGVVGTTLTVGTHIVFWVTLIFWIVDRSGAAKGLRPRWSVKDLPKYEAARATIGQLITGVVWSALLILALVLQQFTFTDVPLLDPANWTFWWPLIIALFVLRALYHVGVHRVGGWTRTVAAVNLLLTAAYTVPLVWLVSSGHFFNPAFHGFLDVHGGDVRDWTGTAIIAVLVVGGAWDVIDSVVRAERSRRGLAPARVPGSGGGYGLGC
ncbi:hypothetical protein ACWT_1843 [Actinoplanes sp. SE50]|uniref:permease prefix domain 1-containing protein n=1 Tax=unclassified Actinoplanes TaxID=2626549 RepID=UPI00023EBB28|nr:MULTISPECIES: permease prefix domain 1-containing protein [unclassified Actinoplanes]AEV82862.1 hypothetical protein ACPL_1965 [Actinoplanes sp. SE50/110]ATO81258.1 hypothetical protein ACWT_1843 [Actinoplanes sp. SE50]SLL98665.1 hypothetical protein ACSP50_1892 [Actinoplanes sp. SE50/110]